MSRPKGMDTLLIYFNRQFKFYHCQNTVGKLSIRQNGSRYFFEIDFITFTHFLADRLAVVNDKGKGIWVGVCIH
jgi:hypothetical protein